MNLPTREEFVAQLKDARISRRLVRDLRYVPEEITHVEQRDFVVVTTKSGKEGVLLYEDMVIPFELSARAANASGRVEAVICDICATWQRGTNSANLTFKMGENRTVSHLVCGDLDCSLHVRGLTAVSKVSRTQLRENISSDGRIRRLHERLRSILEPTQA